MQRPRRRCPVVEVELKLVVLAVIIADAGEVALDAHKGRGEAGYVVEEVLSA